MEKLEYWRYPDGGIYTIKPRYYPASCDACGWQGSSEKCGIDSFGDDSDVYCPVCHSSGCDLGATAAKAVRVNSLGRAALEASNE